jgi:hypothetical protein
MMLMGGCGGTIGSWPQGSQVGILEQLLEPQESRRKLIFCHDIIEEWNKEITHLRVDTDSNDMMEMN